MLVGLCGWSQVSLGREPQKASDHYIHTVWSTDAGLPQNSVTALVQTRDGYLWVGTSGGLARFDGVQFTVFTTANTKGLKSNRIKILYEDRAGHLWIGTEGGGVTRLSQGTWTTYTTKEHLPHDTIESVFEDREGALWVMTMKGLARYGDGAFTAVTRQGDLALNDLTAGYLDRQGNLWLGLSGGGLVSLRDGTPTVHLPPMNDPDNWVRTITETRDGSVWVGTRKGLIQLRAGKIVRYTTQDGLSDNKIVCLLEDRAGTLWVGTENGALDRFVQGKWTVYTKREGWLETTIHCLLEDREGNLWLGSDLGGLIRLKRSEVTALGREHGLPDGTVAPIMADRQGNIWVGSACSGVFRVSAGQMTATSRLSPTTCVWSLQVDSDSAFWYGTWGGGLTEVRDGKLITYTRENSELSSNVVLALYRDRQGTLWIGTQEGLNRFDDGRFTVYRASDGLVHDDVRFIMEDRHGALWLGTVGGLSRFKDGRFTSYTTGDGLSHDFVRDIHEDADGTLWLGTYGGGVNRFNDEKFTTYTTQNGLFDDFISRILEDDRGHFWMSSNKGIFRVGRQELNDYAEGKIKTITSVGYGVADGMATNECNGGGQPAGWKLPDGKLWFPTIKGVAVVDPTEINPLPPVVVIEKVWIDQTSADPWDPAQMPPGRGNLEIHYTGLSLVAPEKVRFKYQLEGYDQEWVDAGARRVAYYTNIPPGAYRFRVRAMNNDGVWNEAGATFEFSLAPHFYQTTWFYGLVGVAVMFIGIAGHRYRLRRLVRRAEELEAKVAERTTELVAERNKLAQAKEQLEQANDDMLSVFNQWRSGVMTTDTEGRVSFLSHTAERLFGQQQADVVGHAWDQAAPLSESDTAQLKAMAERPPEQRSKLSVHLSGLGGQRYWTEIEIKDDPRDRRRKIFFLYDVSEVYDLRRLLDEKAKFHDLVGESVVMQFVYRQIQDLARVETTVLIQGETGTGKELVARAIHYLSPRKNKPFIAVNCAGLTESLLASQLFGHKRGAFTGAVADQVGLFEAAHGGTLFLDEIGDMPLSVQTSLLRVLQEREITRLGETKPRPIDVRVIAATHRELTQEVAAGRFRQDLLYRIRVTQVQLPPLRNRREDIPLLVAWFLGQFRAATDTPGHDMSQEAMQSLMGYEWPGNVRELKSAIESAAISCQGSVIQAADLPPHIVGATADQLSAPDPRLRKKQRVLEALQRSQGNRAAAARLLGVSRATLYLWLKELEIE
jgi:transcriptional regulator with PAS, ATPase and Fis domain/ligand-binding sensor domain-containing protein